MSTGVGSLRNIVYSYQGATGVVVDRTNRGSTTITNDGRGGEMRVTARFSSREGLLRVVSCTLRIEATGRLTGENKHTVQYEAVKDLPNDPAVQQRAAELARSIETAVGNRAHDIVKKEFSPNTDGVNFLNHVSRKLQSAGVDVNKLQPGRKTPTVDVGSWTRRKSFSGTSIGVIVEPELVKSIRTAMSGVVPASANPNISVRLFVPTTWNNSNYIRTAPTIFPSPVEYTVVVRLGANWGTGDPFGVMSAFGQVGTEFHLNFKGTKLDSFTWVVLEFEGGAIFNETSLVNWVLTDDERALQRALAQAANDFGWRNPSVRTKAILKTEALRIQWFNKGQCKVTAICGKPDVISANALFATGADFKIPIPITVGGEVDLEFMWNWGSENASGITDHGKRVVNGSLIADRPVP